MASVRLHRLATALAVVLATGGSACAGSDPDPQPVTVFAAASLTDVLTDLSATWEAAGGAPVRLSFAASSVVARQAEQGAEVDLLALANAAWMDYLDGRDLLEPGTRVRPIGNRLVLVAPSGPDGTSPGGFDPAFVLPDGARLAVGDPAHVPAGQYAREALERLGRWAELEARLALADNVRAALALVERGEVPLGIVYATDAARARGVRVVATFPDSLHAPIVYEVAVLRGRMRPGIAAYLAFLTGPEAAQAFRSAGFTVRGPS